MSDCGCEVEIKDESQKKVLYLLLSINAVMFVFEATLGWYAESTALMADSLDMLADAIVYGIGLYAVGREIAAKARAAQISSYFQATLGILILLDISRRIIFGSDPVSMFMMFVGLVALMANVSCLMLIQNHKDGEVHMRASWIFSANDVIANVGVITSGVLVWWLDSRWPDIVIGVVISLVILRGAKLIQEEAKKELKATQKEVVCSEKEGCGDA